MFKDKKGWLTVAVVNLSVVALLGVVLRSKIMFSIPGIDFKNILQSHSHYAFGGWITLCLMTLMTFEILPQEYSQRPVYKWLLSGIFICAVGMLLSFPFVGYAFLSILFSTLFIFVTYGFAWVFIRDLYKSRPGKAVKLLSTGALLALVLSSVGPFTLAYMLGTHSVNTLLYKDAIYTYLHMQYNGFFTLAVFALFFNLTGSSFGVATSRKVERFSVMLTVSVLPTLMLSYLWHYESGIIRSIAIAGCVCLMVTLALFFALMRSPGEFLKPLDPFARRVGLLSMIAFMLKTGVQVGIIFPSIGKAVFGDRPIIIGYLHLVMLGFVSLYLLAHLLQVGFFNSRMKAVKTGVILFASGVIANEVVLMTQGLGAMIMLSSTIYPLLLLIASIWLFAGAAVIAVPAVKNYREKKELTFN